MRVFRRSKRNVIVACAMVVSVSACATGRGSRPEERLAAPDQTTLRVDNQGFPDVVLYAVTSGTPVRIGFVNGLSKTLLTIPDHLVAGARALTIIARPIAGRAYAIPAIGISPGDKVDVTLAPNPAASYVMVEPKY